MRASGQYVVTQKVFSPNDINPGDPNSCKSFSRSGVVWILSLSVLFHLIYNAIDFESPNPTWNWVLRFLLILIPLAQWLLPLSSINGSSNHTQNLIAFYTIVIGPGIVGGLIIEYVWSMIYYHKRKTMFIHPYVFYTTFISLVLMGLVENGVYDWHIIFTHVFNAWALTFAYASVLFFLHYGCADWKEQKWTSDMNSLCDIDYNTIKGYFILAVSAAFIVVSNVIPYYPTSSVLNMTWLLPWAFVYVAFMVPIIFVEHFLDTTSKADENKLPYLSHIGFIVYLRIVLTAFGFYTMHAGQGAPVNEGLCLQETSAPVSSRRIPV